MNTAKQASDILVIFSRRSTDNFNEHKMSMILYNGKTPQLNFAVAMVYE